MNEANESVEQFDFLSILEPVKIFEDLQVTVCEGNKDSYITVSYTHLTLPTTAYV